MFIIKQKSLLNVEFTELTNASYKTLWLIILYIGVAKVLENL